MLNSTPRRAALTISIACPRRRAQAMVDAQTQACAEARLRRGYHFYRESLCLPAGFDPAPISHAGVIFARGAGMRSRKILLAFARDGGGQQSYTAGPRSPMTVSLSSGTSGTTFVMHTKRWRKLQGYSSSRAHWWAGLRPGTPLIMSAPAWHAFASIQPSIAMHFGNPCVVVSGTFLPRFADRIVDAILRFHPRFLTMFLPMVFSILATARRQGLRGEQHRRELKPWSA